MSLKKPLISKERLLMLVANGLSDAKIAADCKVSRKSVENYRRLWNIPPGTPDGRHGVARLGAEAALAAAEKLVPKGKGGDAEFTRLMLAKGHSFGRTVAPRREFAPIGRLMS